MNPDSGQQGNEERTNTKKMTDTQTVNLGSDRLYSQMKKPQHPGNTVYLLYTLNREAGPIHLNKEEWLYPQKNKENRLIV